jgi:hypothetical protein
MDVHPIIIIAISFILISLWNDECPECKKTKCPKTKCPECKKTKCPKTKCPECPKTKCPECKKTKCPNIVQSALPVYQNTQKTQKVKHKLTKHTTDAELDKLWDGGKKLSGDYRNRSYRTIQNGENGMCTYVKIPDGKYMRLCTEEKCDNSLGMPTYNSMENYIQCNMNA